MRTGVSGLAWVRGWRGRCGSDPGNGRVVSGRSARAPPVRDGRGRQPLALRAGGRLGPITVAYETWGTLDPTRSNAVLVLHALTGDSHAAGGVEPGHGEAGWWDALIGPGRAIDTDQFFVVCSERARRLPGNHGTVVDRSRDRSAVRLAFPTITIRDQIAVEARSPTRSASSAGRPWSAARWAASARSNGP